MPRSTKDYLKVSFTIRRKLVLVDLKCDYIRQELNPKETSFSNMNHFNTLSEQIHYEFQDMSEPFILGFIFV